MAELINPLAILLQAQKAQSDIQAQRDLSGYRGASLALDREKMSQADRQFNEGMGLKREGALQDRAQFNEGMRLKREALMQDLMLKRSMQKPLIVKDPSGRFVWVRPDQAVGMEAGNVSGMGADKAPAGYRFKKDGNLERIPGGPADIKAEAELQKKASGAGDVDVALATLSDAYDRLERGGGITSENKSFIHNIPTSISSSESGQYFGRLLGTRNQSARNDIAMARPALLAALMRATGMSAKQMDSNAELKLWLSTATDPQLDVESNRRALENIRKKYLGGSAPHTGGGQQSGLSPSEQAELDQLRKRFGR